MAMPSNLREKYLTRFAELIADGHALSANVQVFPPHSSGSVVVLYTSYRVDIQWFTRWKTSCLALFDQVVPKDASLFRRIEMFNTAKAEKPAIDGCLGILEAVRENFEKGFLDGLSGQIEAEIAGDYMGQAEALLREGSSGRFDHVPAAVLSGAVLEKALRTLCAQRPVPIPITKPNGDPKTLNPLIDDLKKSDLFNEAKAKQLRAWADIRNHAAHGEFDQFTRGDVEQMVSGINNFLGDYLK